MKRKRFWQIGLALFTAFILIGVGHQPSYSQKSVPMQSQPATLAQNKAKPNTSPNPKTSPKPTATPTEKAPVASPEPPKTPPLPLSKTPYQDPENRFEVGIIQDYKTSDIRGIPLIESPNGNVAYTVLIKPQFSTQKLSQEALAKIAVDALNRGEQFQAGNYQAVGPTSIQLPWTGSLTLGTKSQPISGTILARQEGQDVFLLLISATKEGTTQVDKVLSTLSDTLKIS